MILDVGQDPLMCSFTPPVHVTSQGLEGNKRMQVRAIALLLQARAIENLAWVVAANGVGTQHSTELGGHSAVISPLGEVIAEGSGGEEIVFADVTPGQAQDWREKFPALNDRV